jgi:hypothetical protein
MDRNHYLLRIGDGTHFNRSSIKSIWGIRSENPNCKWFLSNAKRGDILWFVTGNSKGKIVAVATLTHTQKRELGPLLSLTYTNEELGWTETDGGWDTEIHYMDLYNLSNCDLYSHIQSPKTIRAYNEKCKVCLPEEYPYIVRYSKITNHM